MGHLRETFPVLENAATGVGEVLHMVTEGAAPTAKQALIGFSFKDSAGNVVLPQLTSEGKIAVDFEGAGTSLSGSSNGEVAGALSLVTVCDITLGAAKTYGKIHANVCCFKETLCYLIWLDDTTETIIGHALLGPGQYSAIIDLKIKEVVTGAVGTQQFILKAKNLVKISDIMGDMACLEFVG